MQLREATVQDTDAVVDMALAMLHAMASHGGQPLREEGQVRHLLEGRFADGLKKADHVFLLALAQQGEGEPVGMVEASVVSLPGVFRPGSVVHVHSLYVRPRWRRKGIGRALLEAALAWGRGRSCVEAELSVLRGNPARELYEGMGFAVHELQMRLKF